MTLREDPHMNVKDSRWAAVVARDPKADGKFFYSVRTTGVYCRPSCASRHARRENVAFHASTGAAERAGFRPCKRCKPDQAPLAIQHAAMIAKICRRIESAERIPNLATLAREANLSPYHFHRLFKALTGLTPRAYAAAHRAGRVRRELGRSRTVTDAIFDAGFNSGGRFYATSDAVLGMTPSDYRAGGARVEIRFAVGECSLGSILVAQSAKGVCAILLGDDPDLLARDLQDRFPRANLIGADADFEKLIAKIVGFVEAPALGLDLPLDVRGTAFQQRVWQALRKIPA
jgi:AraC family transcriptional regulator, regulatory protein of adaptative response / methylated-DNA-[protein]-cysteine methyltransferase